MEELFFTWPVLPSVKACLHAQHSLIIQKSSFKVSLEKKKSSRHPSSKDDECIEWRQLKVHSVLCFAVWQYGIIIMSKYIVFGTHQMIQEQVTSFY